MGFTDSWATNLPGYLLLALALADPVVCGYEIHHGRGGRRRRALARGVSSRLEPDGA